MLEALYEVFQSPLAVDHGFAFTCPEREDVMASVAYHERLAAAVIEGDVEAAVGCASTRFGDVTRTGC